MSWSQTSRGRRTAAVAALGLATLGPVADGLAGGHLVGTPWFTLAIVAAGFLIGSWLRPWSAVAGAFLGASALTTANQIGDRGAYSVVNDYFFFAVLLGGAVLAGALISGRSAQLRRLRELSRVRARQHEDEIAAARLDEHSRLQTSVAAAMVERLEDVVALTWTARTGADATALYAVEAAGRTVLEELRSVVGVLRRMPSVAASAVDRVLRRPPPPIIWSDALASCAGIPLAVEAVAGSHARGPAFANVVVAVALGLPLLFRRRRPLAATATVFAVAILMTAVLTPLPTTVTVLAPLSLSAYAVGAHLRGLRRLVGVGVLVAGLALTVVVSPPTARDPAGLVPTLVWVGLAVLFGVVSEQYAHRATMVAELLSTVEQGRRHELDLVLAEQRATLAGELHDNLAHAMTVVCLHAEAAQLPGVDPSTVQTSIDAIEGAAGQALVELRSGLTGLLDVDGPVRLDRAITRIAYGLGLHPVIEAVCTSGCAPDESTVLLRVVREALVNVARHAPGAPVVVRLETDVTTIRVSVRNGSAVGTPVGLVGAGSGLEGLDTRVRSAGGRLRWGRRSGGGFEVMLELPRSDLAVGAVR
jgi:signal transduction histidine kinase